MALSSTEREYMRAEARIGLGDLHKRDLPHPAHAACKLLGHVAEVTAEHRDGGVLEVTAHLNGAPR
jgi:hypothetical protein